MSDLSDFNGSWNFQDIISTVPFVGLRRFASQTSLFDVLGLLANFLMTLTALLCLVLYGSAYKNIVLGAPAGGQNIAFSMLDDIESFVIGPATPPYTPSATQSSDPAPYPYTFVYPTTYITETVTVTEDEPVTNTVTQAPTTATEYVTAPPSQHTPLGSPTRPNHDDDEDDEDPPIATWHAPSRAENLDHYGVVKYASGKSNLKVVSGIPASASARPSAPGSNDRKTAPATKPYMAWDNSSSAIQIFYAQGTINPAQSPVGGSEFYAAPLNLTSARNVTFTYSVFFPADFDWVLAGKLPGLYGGHDGCSGGNAALDCFSTRLMWRENGAGELYLYAPKDKQTKSLCEDPQSVCDAAYGLSVGRGAFYWAAGGWTTVTQTVYLNTPGQQDGVFTLDVNGERKISRTDVFYRDDMGGGGGGDGDGGGKDDDTKKNAKTTTTKKPAKKTTTTKKAGKTTTSTSTADDGDILGPILGGLLGSLRRRQQRVLNAQIATTSYNLTETSTVSPRPTAGPSTAEVTSSPAPSPIPTSTSVSGLASVDGVDGVVSAEGVKETGGEVKFVGIFFSTFFGGHEDKYATPKDQYTWFKDFSLVYHG